MKHLLPRAILLASAVASGCATTKTSTAPVGADVEPVQAPSTDDAGAARSMAEQTLSRVPTMAERRVLARSEADAAVRSGKPLEAAMLLVALHRMEPVGPDKTRVEGEIVALIDRELSGRQARLMLESIGGQEPIVEHLQFKVALHQIHIGGSDASEALKRYLERYPSGQYVDRARKQLALIEARAVVRPTVVGALLPLSGSKAAYGRLARQALELAFEGSSVELVVLDTQDSEAVASMAAEKLVVEHGAIAILGPVFRTESKASAVMAQRLRVPLLTISADPKVPSYGPWVFRNGVSNRAEVKALVEYASESMGFTKFAILHPQHPYGEELRDLFWEAVQQRGGSVTGVESYPVDATTFGEPVKRLVGRHDPFRRPDFLAARQACSSERDAYRQKRCRDDVLKKLPPLIDFEALFIPDYARSIRMIAAALAAEDVIVERDEGRLRVIARTLGRTPKVVTLLGPHGWNSPKLTESTGRTVENAVFTAGFFVRADDERVARFVQRYREVFGREPRLYPEALMYDCARLVRSIVEQTSPRTRADFREALLLVQNYPGVTGRTSFAGQTDALKDLRLLTVENGVVKEMVQPAEVGGSRETASP